LKTLKLIADQVDRDIKAARETLQTTNDYATQIRCRQIIKKFGTLAIKLKKARKEIKEQLQQLLVQ